MGVCHSRRSERAYLKACEKGTLRKAYKLSTKKHVNVSSGNQQAIINAAEHGHHHVVTCLLEEHPGVDPGARGNLAIIRAARNGHHKVVSLLLQDERVDPTIRNHFPLRIAAMQGYTQVLQVLLEDARTNLYVRDAEGRTLPELARAHGHERTAQQLEHWMQQLENHTHTLNKP